MRPDLTAELAKLLNFTAHVALAIRRHSAYNPEAARQAHAPFDVMWLSDSLHNFSMLGHAILNGTPHEILVACNAHLSIYESYLEAHPNSELQAQAAFERNVGRVRLSEAMDVFRAIRMKVLPLTISPAD